MFSEKEACLKTMLEKEKMLVQGHKTIQFMLLKLVIAQLRVIQ